MTQGISVKHNFEAAHRLYTTPGKCQQIHGHSFWATLTLHGNVDPNGLVCGIDFGDLKKAYRSFLDNTFDHRVLLNRNDPWARGLYNSDSAGRPDGERMTLPGLAPMSEDPTTENLARWIGEYMRNQVQGTGITLVEVHLQETSVNAATWRSDECSG